MTRGGWLALSLAASGLFLSETLAYGADPAVVEVGMISKPEGTQFMMLGRGSVHSGPIVFRVMNRSADMVHEFRPTSIRTPLR
jgi:hypothetical protein